MTTTDEPVVRLYQPDLSGNERRYVGECLDSSWISSAGAFVARFEQEFAKTIGAPHAISTSSGTTALHLALHALGVGPEDEVIVPSFTYIAPVNMIAQTGATPIFVDSRADDWLLDPEAVARLIGPRTRAIVAVHLYGGVCDLAALSDLATRHGLALVEDAAEAVGCTWNGRHAGTVGLVGTFSFYGNKTMTTGEGGMVVTSDARLAERLRLLRGQGHSPTRRYWHTERGFNYRMTNLCAAIGVAQIERLPVILTRKQAIAALYREMLQQEPVVFQRRSAIIESNEWLLTVLLPNDIDRDSVIALMERDGIETRPTFYCAHTMPMYDTGLQLPRAEEIARRGISLPSHPQLADRDVRRVCRVLSAAVRQCRGGASALSSCAVEGFPAGVRRAGPRPLSLR